jgi:hypothetical protein
MSHARISNILIRRRLLSALWSGCTPDVKSVDNKEGNRLAGRCLLAETNVASPARAARSVDRCLRCGPAPEAPAEALLATNRNWWKAVKLDVAGALQGGEPAANRLTGYLKPERTTIYFRQGIAPLLGLGPFLPARDEWNTEFLPVFWNFDDALEKKGTVPGPLVYADLMATGDDRCIETAKRIYDQHLAATLGHD